MEERLLSQMCVSAVRRYSSCQNARKVKEKFSALSNLNFMVTETVDQEKVPSDASKGRLKDMPFVAKDNFATKGLLTTCGSKMLHSFIPGYNATVIQRLLDEGAFLVGKTNMDEFAMGCGSVDSIHGPVRNPWQYDFSRSTDPNYKTWRIAGGSSGGTAVAVATSVARFGLSSDTGGSTRNPAAYCGVVGLKPTYGLVSRHGLVSLVNSLDVPGIMAKTVDDAALVLEIIAGADGLDSTTSRRTTDVTTDGDLDVRGLKVGIPQEFHTPGLSPSVLSAWHSAADAFSDAGADVTSVSMPFTKHAVPCYSVLCAADVASNMARYDGVQYGYRADVDSSTDALYAASRSAAFNDVVRGRILAGQYFLLRQHYKKYYDHAMRIRRLIANDFARVFREVDVLLTPTVRTEAPIYEDFIEADNRTRTMEEDVLTQSANLAGVPALSLPHSLSPSGLPVAVQLIANKWREKTLFRAAKSLEKTAIFPDWATTQPNAQRLFQRDSNLSNGNTPRRSFHSSRRRFHDLTVSLDSSSHGAGCLCHGEYFRFDYPAFLRRSLNVTTLNILPLALATYTWTDQFRGKSVLAQVPTITAARAITNLLLPVHEPQLPPTFVCRLKDFCCENHIEFKVKQASSVNVQLAAILASWHKKSRRHDEFFQKTRATDCQARTVPRSVVNLVLAQIENDVLYREVLQSLGASYQPELPHVSSIATGVMVNEL